jgi:hypothetical protein
MISNFKWNISSSKPEGGGYTNLFHPLMGGFLFSCEFLINFLYFRNKPERVELQRHYELQLKASALIQRGVRYEKAFGWNSDGK